MKKITFAITGRNDNYNPYFISRFSYCLNFASFSLEKLGLEEFVRFSISDWGSKKKLKDSLLLTKETSKLIDFYEIEEELAIQHSLEEDRFFSNAKAHNIAIRRSATDFIAFTSHDYIMNQLFFSNLYNLLNQKIYKDINLENSFFIVPRKTLPDKLFQFTPNFDLLEDWLNKTSELESDLSVKHGGGGGAYLTSKNNWKKLGGIDERYRKWGVLEYDLFSRASLIGLTYETSKLGIWQFKLPRGHAKVRDKSIKDINKKWFSENINPNNKNWGLFETKILKKINYKHVTSFDFNKKIVKFENNNNNIFFNFLKIFHKVFLIKCSIRIKYISLKQILVLNLIDNILNVSNCRGINFIGYENFFLPSCLSFKNNTINYNFLDDFSLNLKKLNFSDENNLTLERGNLIYNRSILLQEILMKSNHLGYVNFTNGTFREYSDLYFYKFTSNNYSNIVVVNCKLLNEQGVIELIKKLSNNSIKISFIILYDFENNIKNLFSKNFEKNFKLEMNQKNILIFKNDDVDKLKLPTYSKTINLYLFCVSNIMYFTYMFLRLIRNRIFKKIFKSDN